MKRKIHQHKFADRFPAFAAILLLFGGLAATQVGGMLINVPFALGITGYTSKEDAVGFTEEVAFRGLPASLLMRQWREEKRILTIMILTSAVFGDIHFTNYFAGADFGSSIMQTFGAAGMGLFFCGIYLRCGNLLVPIAVHALHDLLSFLDVSGIQDGIVVQAITWFSFLDLAFSIGLGILGIWMVRPSTRAEIRRLWNRKWRIANVFCE